MGLRSEFICWVTVLHPLAEFWRFVSLECILGAVWKSTKFLCGCHKKDVKLFFQQNLEYCIHDQIICIRMKTFWQFIICKKCNCSRVGIQHMCLDQSRSQFFELSTTGNKTRKRVMANIAKSKTSFYRSPAVVIVIKKGERVNALTLPTSGDQWELGDWAAYYTVGWGVFTYRTRALRTLIGIVLIYMRILDYMNVKD